MAIIKQASSDPNSFKTSPVVKVVWASLKNTDSGDAFSAMDLPDKTVQVKGTFGAGGTVVIEDDQDHVLRDLQGNNLSFTAAGTKLIAENPESINPRVTGGDATTDITVTIYATGK